MISHRSATSFLATHGRLWYDDPWYRAAWLVWPQATVILISSLVWSPHEEKRVASEAAHWAKPITASTQMTNDGTAAPLSISNFLEVCISESGATSIQACTTAIDSGKLSSEDLGKAYFNRADAYSETSDKKSLALPDYDKAISVARSVPRYRLERGVYYLKNKEPDKAIRDFDAAIIIDPGYALAYANRSTALFSMGKIDEALEQANIALKLNDKLSAAYSARASIYEKRGDWKPLYDDASKLIELKPSDAQGYGLRGRTYFEGKQYDLAVTDYSKAISLRPNVAAYYEIRGRSYALMGLPDKAMADYAAALKIDPNDQYATYWMNDLRAKK